MTTHLRNRPFGPETHCGRSVCNITVVYDMAACTCRTCLKIATRILRDAEFKRTVSKPKRKHPR